MGALKILFFWFLFLSAAFLSPLHARIQTDENRQVCAGGKPLVFAVFACSETTKTRIQCRLWDGFSGKTASDAGVFYYHYNQNGQLESKTHLQTATQVLFSWDAKNQLVGIKSKDGATITTIYTADYYPGSDLRSSSAGPSGVVTFHLYEGVNEKENIDPATFNAVRVFSNVPGVYDARLSRKDSPTATGEAAIYLTDEQNSVLMRYVPFAGPEHEKTFSYYAFGGLREGSDPMPEGDFGFQGRPGLALAGLQYFRGRHYDSCSGAFISEDPYKDGNNWMGAFRGNPVNNTDPTGYMPPQYFSPEDWKEMSLKKGSSEVESMAYMMEYLRARNKVTHCPENPSSVPLDDQIRDFYIDALDRRMPYFTMGITTEISTVHPGGGGKFGYNLQFVPGYGVGLYEKYTPFPKDGESNSEGLSPGFTPLSFNLGHGSGSYTGWFDEVDGSVKFVGGGYYQSPDFSKDSGWRGLSIGPSFGIPWFSAGGSRVYYERVW